MNQKVNSPSVALVTGASSGFGLLVSVALAHEGYRVIASMRNMQNKEMLTTVASEASLPRLPNDHPQQNVGQPISRSGRDFSLCGIFIEKTLERRAYPLAWHYRIRRV